MDLFESLVSVGDKRLSNRLKGEIVSTLKSLDNLERNNKGEHVKKWLKIQEQKIQEVSK